VWVTNLWSAMPVYGFPVAHFAGEAIAFVVTVAFSAPLGGEVAVSHSIKFGSTLHAAAFCAATLIYLSSSSRQPCLGRMAELHSPDAMKFRASGRAVTHDVGQHESYDA
jgi:hypothetical protein